MSPTPISSLASYLLPLSFTELLKSALSDIELLKSALYLERDMKNEEVNIDDLGTMEELCNIYHLSPLAFLKTFRRSSLSPPLFVFGLNLIFFVT